MQKLSIVGKRVPRVDALEKVTGKAKYGVDVELPRILHAKVLRSKYPHARILSIDASEAEKLPGVRAVITAEDTLKEKVETTWRGMPDKYPLAMDKVRYVGEEIAAVAAEDELIAEEALRLIRVEYEELPAVFDPEEAMKPGAPKTHDVEHNIIHEVNTEFGDVDEGFKEADHIFEDRFATAYIHMCHLEPTVCVASFDSSDKLTFWENSMDPFMYRRLVAKALGVIPSKIRIIQKFIGGNFGHCQCDLAQYVITALLARKTGRPVRLVNTREEELGACRPRQPVITYLKYGVKKDGTLTARHIRTIVNSGAYCGYAPQMMVTGLAECAGFYRCPNVKLEGICVYTNTLPTSPSCCFGIKQPQFAQESLMDRIAEELSIDPVEFRLRNTVRAGDVTVLGQKIGSCGLQECLQKVAEYTGWREKRAKKQPNRGIGMACAMSHSDGMGRMEGQFGGDIAYVQILEDGKVRIISGEFEWGQGSYTVLSQIVAEELGVPLEKVEFSDFNTDVLPHTLGPYGEGRVTLVAGHAVRLAALDAKRQLLTLAAEMLGVRSEGLEMRDQKIFVSRAPEKAVSIADVATYGRYTLAGAEVIGKGVWEPSTALLDLHKVYGNYSSGYIFYAQVAEVEVDPETGKVKVLNFASGNDLGRAINPMAAEGQSEGDIGREIGETLMEEIMYERGTVINPNFIDYRLPTAINIPSVKTFLVESNEPNGPYGAKGTAHPGIPTAAALANAIYDAVGVRIKELPMTPMKILKALEEKREGR